MRPLYPLMLRAASSAAVRVQPPVHARAERSAAEARQQPVAQHHEARRHRYDRTGERITRVVFSEAPAGSGQARPPGQAHASGPRVAKQERGEQCAGHDVGRVAGGK